MAGDSVISVGDRVTGTVQGSGMGLEKMPCCKVFAAIPPALPDSQHAAVLPVLGPPAARTNHLLNKWHGDKAVGGERGLRKLVFSI